MDLARVPRAVGAYWRAQVHLWEVYLSADPWPPRHLGGEPLHWAGRRLRGSVLPGP